MSDPFGPKGTYISSGALSSQNLVWIRIARGESQLFLLFFVRDPCVIENAGGEDYLSVNNHMILIIFWYSRCALFDAQWIFGMAFFIHTNILTWPTRRLPPMANEIGGLRCGLPACAARLSLDVRRGR